MDLKMAEDYFHISTKGSENPLLSIPATEILELDKLREVLEQGSALIKGTGLQLAVSFMGLAVFGLAATKQYVMSYYNRILDLSLNNITVQLESHGDHAHIVFKLADLKWEDLPESHEQRKGAILAEWRSYFATTMNPLIEASAASAGMKPDLIWNQYGSRMAFMMDYVRGNVPEGPLRQRFEDDFLLMCELPPETFNRKRKNPFVHTPQYIDSPYKPGQQVMIRSSCCMYYCRENGVKCYTCPILKEDQRMEMKREIEAKQEKAGA